MKQRGFTLVEMIVVIFVIGILVAITMNLNAGSINLLQNKMTSEKVIHFFDTLFIRINSSNYVGEKNYDTIQVHFLPNKIQSNYMSIKEDTEELLVSEEMYDFVNLEVLKDGNPGELPVSINYLPFKTNCTLLGDDGNLIEHFEFRVESKGRKKSCFALNNTYCKIKAITCDHFE